MPTKKEMMVALTYANMGYVPAVQLVRAMENVNLSVAAFIVNERFPDIEKANDVISLYKRENEIVHHTQEESLDTTKRLQLQWGEVQRNQYNNFSWHW